MRPIIEVERMGKLYHLGPVGLLGIRSWFSKAVAETTALGRDRDGEASGTFWALRDVSFDVQPGEVVGLVGRNGAGKSTLLKLLSRITEPTSGRATLRGRVASLLEVGTGFHPDLTGRENIYLNGAILGMKRAEIARKFDEIVEFAEMGAFLDTPVKRYSSGMYVRLAFAVAAHLDPEILIIDEVLAVGDAAFQKKCLGKMHHVASRGRTVLFVSHNMGAVQTLCSKAVMLEDGRVAAVGETRGVLARYLQRGGEDSDTWMKDDSAKRTPLQFERAHLRVEGDAPNQRLHLELELHSTSTHRPAFVAVDVLNSLGNSVMQALPSLAPYIVAENEQHIVRITIDLPPLIPGHYPVTLWVGPHFSETYETVERAMGFDIEQSPTQGRTFAHSPDHGYIVPESTFDYMSGETASLRATATA
jgi:lipopolysaccharide transport system ATP-binding protein